MSMKLFSNAQFEVTGIDSSYIAISKALEKAETRHLHDKTTFIKMNLFDLKELDMKFNTVIDSGVFHMFDTNSRYQYQKVVGHVLNSNGILYILAFSYLEPLGIGPSQRLTEEDYIETFKDSWKILNFEQDKFETRFSNERSKGLLTTIKRM